MLEDAPIACSVDDTSVSWDIKTRLVIELDDVRQGQVIAYDCEAGWVERYKMLNGQIVLNEAKDECVWERVSGLVEVRLKDA